MLTTINHYSPIKAPAKSAPAPNAPRATSVARPAAAVDIAVPLPLLPAPLDAVGPVPPAAVGTAIVAVGVGTPDVKGASEAEVAPGNAAAVLVGFGATDVALGFKTLRRNIQQ